MRGFQPKKHPQDVDEDEAYFNDETEDSILMKSTNQVHKFQAREEVFQQAQSQQIKSEQNPDEIDPLDAFMMELNSQIQQAEAEQKKAANKSKQEARGEIMENDEEDAIDHLVRRTKKELKQMKGKKGKTKKSKNPDENEEGEEEDDEFDDFMDPNGEIDFEKIHKFKKRKIEPLPEINHYQEEYEAFQKNFYKEHPDLTKLTTKEVYQIRADFGIKVYGSAPPKPILSFGHLMLEEKILQKLRSKKYEKPTPIQSQAIPAGLAGRDIIGVAKTGSGKTLAYVIPMIVHILDQRVLEKGEGPISLVIAPTRELCRQIYIETKRYAKPYGINVLSLVGGDSKTIQWKSLLNGVEIIIGTPGRIIDIARKKGFNFKRVTYVIIDEADMMFMMGFHHQIKILMSQIRPDRQTQLFSATFKTKIQNLCEAVLCDPIKIVVGKLGMANEDITQFVEVLENEDLKYSWLVRNLPQLLQQGQILIFANKIASVEELYQKLSLIYPYQIVALHGDKVQQEREQILYLFKSGKMKVMVATSIGSRGLDIPLIKTIINYEPAKNKEDHVHRIGRTGRAGDKTGVAYTLLLNGETKKAALMVRIMEEVGQPISAELEKMAMSDAHFKNSRQTIGIKNFNMKININKDSKKIGMMAAQSRKKEGLGYKSEQRSKKIQKPLDPITMLPAMQTVYLENPEHNQFSRPPNMLIEENESTSAGPMASRINFKSSYAGKIREQMKDTFHKGFVSGGTISKSAKEKGKSNSNGNEEKKESQSHEETIDMSKLTGNFAKPSGYRDQYYNKKHVQDLYESSQRNRYRRDRKEHEESHSHRHHHHSSHASHSHHRISNFSDGPSNESNQILGIAGEQDPKNDYNEKGEDIKNVSILGKRNRSSKWDLKPE